MIIAYYLKKQWHAQFSLHFTGVLALLFWFFCCYYFLDAPRIICFFFSYSVFLFWVKVCFFFFFFSFCFVLLPSQRYPSFPTCGPSASCSCWTSLSLLLHTYQTNNVLKWGLIFRRTWNARRSNHQPLVHSIFPIIIYPALHVIFPTDAL